jgi:hypothetical protein
MRPTFLLPAALALGLGACAEGQMSPTTQRVGGSAALGALGGAAIGSLSGNAGWGALIGAGTGAAGGFLYDRHVQSRDRAFQQGVAAGRASPR